VTKRSFNPYLSVLINPNSNHVSWDSSLEDTDWDLTHSARIALYSTTIRYERDGGFILEINAANGKIELLVDKDGYTTGVLVVDDVHLTTEPIPVIE
jgi:hypothetical protein